MAEVRGRWPTPGFTWYRRRHLCVFLCASAVFAEEGPSVSVWGVMQSVGHVHHMTPGSVSHPPTDTDEVTWVRLKDCSEGWAVELTFTSPGGHSRLCYMLWQSGCLISTPTVCAGEVKRAVLHSLLFFPRGLSFQMLATTIDAFTSTGTLNIFRTVGEAWLGHYCCNPSSTDRGGNQCVDEELILLLCCLS